MFTNPYLLVFVLLMLALFIAIPAASPERIEKMPWNWSTDVPCGWSMFHHPRWMHIDLRHLLRPITMRHS